MLRTPRTDPSKRYSRTRLPPRVFDVEALRGPRVKDARRREPGFDESQHPLPRQGGLLATPRQRAFPKYRDVVAESHEGPGVRGHGMVGKESRRDLL